MECPHRYEIRYPLVPGQSKACENSNPAMQIPRLLVNETYVPAIRRDGWMDLRRGGGCGGGETLEETGAEGLGGGARVG